MVYDDNRRDRSGEIAKRILNQVLKSSNGDDRK
jgi:hypothetical protein